MHKGKVENKVSDVGSTKGHDVALEEAMRACLTPYERAELLLLVEIGKRLDILTAMVEKFMPKGR
jgi:hypothetical protein